MTKPNGRRVRPAKPIAHQREPLPWHYFLLMFVCVCAVAAGFFFAAIQHFSTMDLGIKNSKLRKQVEDLEAEKRRLLLAKEISLSPYEVTKTARKLGFSEMGDLQRLDVIQINESLAKDLKSQASKPIDEKKTATREVTIATAAKVAVPDKDTKSVKAIASVAPSTAEPVDLRPRKVIVVGNKSAEASSAIALAKLR